MKCGSHTMYHYSSGHVEGEKVAGKMYEHLVNNGIPVHRMASLIRVGPNVNKTIFRKMNELILQDCPEFPGLIDLGSCSIHVIHNAFGKGLEKHGKEVDQHLYGSTFTLQV